MKPCDALLLPPAATRTLRQPTDPSCPAARSIDENDAVLRAGVVGLGHQALTDHLPNLQASADIRLAAVCDENPAVVHEQQHRLRVPGYLDFEDMLASEQLDLVVVCVPHHVGGRVIEAAAKHGVHVLKEKPFATTVDEAKRLATVCEESGIHLMVALQRRLNPIHTSFQLLADRVGTPFLVEGRYTMHITDPSDGWRGLSAKAGGGCLIDMGYHLIDLTVWYFGLPDQITADLSASARPDRRYDAEDTALVHFSYDHGLYGSLLLSRFLGPKTEELRVVGDRGAVHLERNRIRRLTNRGEVVETISRESAGQAAAANQIDYFARVIDGSRPNPSSPKDQLAHLAFITACYQAARTHAPVNPKELL